MFKDENLVCVAKIICPFGVKGLVKVKSFMANATDIFKFNLYDIHYHQYKFTFHSSPGKELFIVKINDIEDRTEIEKFGKLSFYIPRPQLPELTEDEYYISDLKNISVLDGNYNEIGILNDIFNFGAGDIFEVKFADNTKILYPFNKDYFPKITKEYIMLKPKM